MLDVQIDRSSPNRLTPSRFRFVALVFLLACMGFGGCAQSPQTVSASHGKEYFPSSIYGRASRRVVEDGQPVPRGGGQYLVGKPYTIAGRTYFPSESKATQVGSASWYGDAFHGRLTANGEIYDRDAFTAASPTLPLPSYARVTNLRNNYSMIVRVNDRGPYASDRIMDVSRKVAEALDYKRNGTTKLKVEYVGRASLAGSDDTKLLATLRTDKPAPWQTQPTMVASVAPRVRVASMAPYVPEPYRPQYKTSRVRTPDDFEEGPVATRRMAVAEEPARPRMSRDLRDRDDDRPSRHRMAEIQENDGRPVYRHEQHRDATESRQRFAQNLAPESRRSDRYDPTPPKRVTRSAVRESLMPPSRPMDLGTIPGAASQIRAHHEPSRFHVARSRDD